MIITKTSSRRTIHALTRLDFFVVILFTIAECCSCRGVGIIAIGKVVAFPPRNYAYSTASSFFRMSTTGPQTLFNHNLCHHHNQQHQLQLSICQHSSSRRQRRWHFALPMQLPDSQQEETLFESQNIQNNYYHHRRIVVVMPKYPTYIDESSRRIEDNGSSSTLSWQLECSRRHLKQIASEYRLPILEEEHNNYETNTEQSINECYHDYTHYLTAVSYPRIASYAIAIGIVNNNNNQKRKKRKTKMSSSTDDAYFVDLCPPQDTGLGYRLHKNSRGGGGGEELLLKALGMKKLFNRVDERRDDMPIIIFYDVTAGLARDSLVILTSFLDHWDTASSSSSLWHGITPQLKLHMIERDPIVALLLADAMRRLNLLADHDGSNESHSISDYVVTEDERCTAQKMQQCLSMEAGDGVTVLSRLMTSILGDSAGGTSTQRPDICYLDPMFPPRKKQKSAVKKDMAMLHSLLGTAEEAVKQDETMINADGDNHASGVLTEVERLKEEQALILAACKVAKKRVVVKRPIGAKPLGMAISEVNCGASGDGHSSIINLEDIPKPSFVVRGSVNRFDVYLMS